MMARIPNWCVVVGVFVGIPVLLVASIMFFHRDLTLDGPTLVEGFVAVVVVRDRGFGPGADHEADVVIRDAEGKELVRDRDALGGYGDEGARRVVASMRWVEPGVLEYEQMEGVAERLRVPEEGRD